MTDTIENLNRDVDLKLEDLLEELRQVAILRATEVAYEVTEYVPA